MSVKTIQYLLASVFFVLGGWCLFSPGSVLELTITPAYRSDAPIVPILIGAFGAQAMIAGGFAAFSTFTRTTFLAYGLMLLPFFAFDWWFYAVEPMLTEIGLLDAVGNIAMLALCVLGWRAAGQELAASTKPEQKTPPSKDRASRLSIAAGLGLALIAAETAGVVEMPAFVGKAEARIGQPLTPASGAGVARRTTRRAIRRTAPAVIPVLPSGCTRVVVDGLRVWRCGGAYYRRAAKGYAVVVVD